MARAGLGVIIVCVVPGAIAASLLGFSLRALRTWAALPALSLAVVFIIGEVAQLVHVPFGAVTVIVVLTVLTGIAFVPRVRESRVRVGATEPDVLPVGDSVVGDSAEQPVDRFEHQIAWVLLLLGIAVGLFTWLHGMGGHDLVPPGSDAAYHGFFVARIMHAHSIEISRIAVSDPSGLHAVVSYYPLAMHAAAAVAAQLTGAGVGQVLVAFTVLFAAVVFPVGMFTVARMLAPSAPLVAGFTALAVPALAFFPYGVIQFGDVPVIVGLALVPITVVLVADAVIGDGPDSRWRYGPMIAAALALVTAIAVHSSQVPVVIVLVGLLALERAYRQRSPRILGRAALGGLAVTVFAAVLLAPVLRSFGSGVSERSAFDNTTARAARDVIGGILSLDSRAFIDPGRQTLLALLAGAGVVVWLFRRRFGWVLGYALFLGLMLFAAVSESALSKALSLPWYRGPGRIGWNRALFVAFFVGVALAFAVTSIARLFEPRRPALVWTSVVAVVLFGAVIGYQGYRTSSAMVRYSFAHDAIFDRNSEAALAWLHAHAGAGDSIVNDVNQQNITTDDALWMYAQRGLRPLFGFGQATNAGFRPPDSATVDDLDDRSFLLRNLGQLGRNRRVDDLARRYHARWVYFDEREITAFRHTLTLAALKANPRLHLAFHRGPVYVFEMSV